MVKLKTQIKIVLILTAIISILVACNSPVSSYQGGYLQMNEPLRPSSLFPSDINNATEYHIASQIHAGLVKYNCKTLEIEPSISKYWTLNQEMKVFTFNLYTNYFFCPDSCFGLQKTRKVTAKDFKYSFELLAAKKINPPRFYGTIDEIEGAVEFYEDHSLGGISGIKVINDSTLQLILCAGNPMFIHRVADISASVISKEAYQAYGEKCLVGAGAFMLKNYTPKNDSLILYKNPFFPGRLNSKNTFPYLDSVKITFSVSTHEELARFERGELDVIIGLPPTFVNDFLEKNIQYFQSDPPLYILSQTTDMNAQNIYNLLKGEIQNFYTNSMNYIDLSVVKQKPMTEKQYKSDTLP